MKPPRGRLTSPLQARPLHLSPGQASPGSKAVRPEVRVGASARKGKHQGLRRPACPHNPQSAPPTLAPPTSTQPTAPDWTRGSSPPPAALAAP